MDGALVKSSQNVSPIHLCLPSFHYTVATAVISCLHVEVISALDSRNVTMIGLVSSYRSAMVNHTNLNTFYYVATLGYKNFLHYGTLCFF